jgi:hypothetical protein
MIFKKALGVCTGFILFSMAWAKCDLLMVAYDTGDALAIKAISEAIDHRISQGEKFTYKILAFGTSYEKFKDHSSLLSPESCSGFSMLLPKGWNRKDVFSPQLVGCILETYQPKKVMVGLASLLQAQFAKEAHKRGIKTVGFYDAFHNPSDLSNDFDKAVRQAVLSVDAVILPYQGLKDSFLSLNPQIECLILGQPAYETWNQDKAKYDPKKTLEKLGYKNGKIHSKAIVLTGGYDDIYKKTFEEVFLKAIPHLNNIEIFITLHPKLGNDDSYEKSKVIGYKNVHVLLPKNSQNPDGFTTEEIAGIADTMVCVRSTTGIKAALAGQPVIYIDADPTHYKNPLISKKVVRQVSSPYAFVSALNQINKSQHTPKNLAGEIGMPLGAGEKIARYLIEG